jgi:guanyl-specific ribonuclease Sa
MKTLVPIGMLVLIVGGAVLLPRMGDKVGYVKETVTVTEEVTPDWASDPEAVQAAQDVIKKKELEAEEARLVDEITSKQDELDAIRKELGSY